MAVTVGANDGFALAILPDGPATTSWILTRLAAGPAAPSLPTIASAGAMCAIAHSAKLDKDHTRHRPRPVARTGAPCCTRNAAPPGRPTGFRRKTVPAGRAHGLDDEDGATATVTCDVQVQNMVTCWRADERRMVGVFVSGRVRTGVSALGAKLFRVSAPPRPAHPRHLSPVQSPFPLGHLPSTSS